MKSNNEYLLVNNLLSKYQLNNKFLRLENLKYYSSYIDRIVYDYKYMDTLDFNNSRWSRLPYFGLKCLIIIGGALVSVFKTHRYNKKINHKIKEFKAPIIAVPVTDNFVRLSMARKLATEKIDIYYHPFFHFDTIIKHIEHYNASNEQVYFDSFKFSDIIASAGKLFLNYCSLKRCSSELDAIFDSSSCKLPGILFSAVLYRRSMERFVSSLPDADKKIIWLMDLDFEYKYFTFNDIIHKLRPNDKSVHIQHGSFYTYQPAYCNPCSDVSLCCSDRERAIIENFNKYNAKIVSFGAPLQSFIGDKNIQKYSCRHDVLILLTDTYTNDSKRIQADFLKQFDFKKYDVLIRFRPVSREEDLAYLGKFCDGATISNDSTLDEDVDSAKTVVSFSEDALYVCLRKNKRIVVVCPKDPQSIYNFEKPSNNIIITNNPDQASQLDWAEFVHGSFACDYSTDEFALYNFGMNSWDKLCERFHNVLESI